MLFPPPLMGLEATRPERHGWSRIQIPGNKMYQIMYHCFIQIADISAEQVDGFSDFEQRLEAEKILPTCIELIFKFLFQKVLFSV